MSANAESKPISAASAAFGANEWLVDELYEQYLKDKNLVDPAWWEFFADYRPTELASPAGQAASGTGTADQAATSSTPVASTPAEGAGAPARQTTSAQPAPSTEAQVQVPAASAPGTAPQAENEKATQAATAQAPLEDPADLTSPPVATARPATAPYAHQPATRADATHDDVGSGEVERLRGPAARVVTNMETSLEVPTATSVRGIPAKLMVDNRIVMNNHMSRARGGKVSFTHIIGFALIEALVEMPAMNSAYAELDGKPAVSHPAAVNFGLAIDLAKPDGTRQLLVPSVKDAESMDFSQFWAGYEDLVRRARNNKLTVDDFTGTTITLTNPGTIGTVHSVPRLMSGQGTIIGVGALNYPAEFQGASEERLAEMGVSKVLTISSTYDHRVIQGAQSGDFLRILEHKLLGKDGIYDRIFAALHIPYEPVRWVQDQTSTPDDEAYKPGRISELIHSFRSRGHLIADIDPLAYRQRRNPDLDVQTHGLTLWDLDRIFPTGGFGGKQRDSLRNILGLLRDSYCRTIGIEYMHLADRTQRKWLQDRLEAGYERTPREEQLRILRRLNAAEAFETFLQTKFVGQKRFSLEGSESVIPLLDAILTQSARSGLHEVCIGMAHRGRLNVLANIAGKSYGQIFAEFEGNLDPYSIQGSGDVKYHLGTEGTFKAETGEKTMVYLAANPSHLEAVNGVLEGIVRAKQDRIDLGGDGYSVLPVLIHGDAAFSGQGVVTETLNLAGLRGYRTGGTIHVIINNQVGFTAGPSATRSTLYATDVAKGLQVPIFHVNGDDPEAVVRVAELAFEFREQFDRDVIIDMISYRRRGHNEGDDPSMTQPLMYNLIDAKRSVRKLYTENLVSRGDINLEEAEQVLQDYQNRLERVFTETKQGGFLPPGVTDEDQVLGLDRPESQREDAGTMVGWQTAVPTSVLERIGEAHVSPPEGFKVHPKLSQLLERREAMSRDGAIDWGFGELLAFGSLLIEGTPVRLAGQDSRRGTFVQRHAVMHDAETGAEWTPLLYLSGDQAKFWVYDSLLSEYAALAFEYGYSVERPDALVLWEAQFGDFVNGAQTVIDEFISSAEQKWGQRSSVVLLLPHGYEGQGPDHSSARIERFLQLAAEDNMVIAQPSTPASHFHLLRRQAYERPRRPLIAFTPKQLLRLRAAASSVEDFTTGGFQTVIGDPFAEPAKAGNVDRVLLCSGRVYFDLLARRAKIGDERTGLVRVEQLYPLDGEALRAAVAPFPNAELVWVQDEPENQGPWPFMAMHAPEELGQELTVVARPASASPSVGTSKVHAVEQEELLSRAFPR